MEKKWNLISAVIISAVWLALALTAWVKPPTLTSDTERRELEQFPEITAKALLDGTFMQDFESYTLDQFPFRDGFRRLKAGFHYNVLQQKDNNGIYLAEGYAAKIEYPLNVSSVEHAVTVFGRIYDKYLQNCRVFVSVVPDKGYYLAQKHGYPAMDYHRLFDMVAEGMPYASYVNLTDCLAIEDYYRTDTHWRQERLLPAAQRLCRAMDTCVAVGEEYLIQKAERPFYGVYYGQAALPMEPEELYTMESQLLKTCRVYSFETDSYGEVYDRQKLEGKDLYEVFLSGPVSLLRIENPDPQTERELIVFRDSFGSSLAPLLVQGYKTVTLVDVRYISSAMLDRFIQFNEQDVLFLYSTLVLNNSFMLK